MAGLFKHFTDRVARLVPDAATQAFVRHNRKAFTPTPDPGPNAPIVLIESNNWHSAHVAYGYLARVLADRYNARITSYLPELYSTRAERLKATLRRLLGVREFGVYRSFGVDSCVVPKLSADQALRADLLCAEILAEIESKLDIEAITIREVWIGDLIYDSYLRDYNKPTVDWRLPEFRESLLGSIRIFVFWEDFFEANDVRAINASHCVYNVAIPLRIALKKGIPAFQANATHVFRLRPDNMFAYTDFHYFRERFDSLPEDVCTAGMEEAKARISRRFAGEVGVDMSYSTKSAYGASRHPRLVRESPRTKVLIATHCFYDNPHSYGNNLFPDFYEWLDFLGRMTEQTNYDWYIKTHADFLPGTKQIIDSFVEKYPRFTLLPPDSSHHQLIAEGIDVALTVLGTIAFEYAALGKRVINASLNNPHISYDFNFHPRSLEEYRQLLMDLDRLEISIDQNQVYEFYFMKHIYNNENWLFSSMDRTISELGGYAEQFTTKVYPKWLAEWSPERHAAILSALGKFVESGDFRIDSRHLARAGRPA